jgi:hypothetical protein
MLRRDQQGTTGILNPREIHPSLDLVSVSPAAQTADVIGLNNAGSAQ